MVCPATFQKARGEWLRQASQDALWLFHPRRQIPKIWIWHGHKRSRIIEQEIGATPLKRSWENPRNKEDAAINAAITQQPAAAACNPEDSVWGYLKIQPCGPREFQILLESRWSSRNGQRATVIIGECVDDWEAAYGAQPRGAAPLFRALSSLRAVEKDSKPQGGAGGIHVFTPEEIPARLRTMRSNGPCHTVPSSREELSAPSSSAILKREQCSIGSHPVISSLDQIDAFSGLLKSWPRRTPR